MIDDDQAFMELCAYVDGMPLALELAAGWVDTLSVGTIVKEIQHNLDMLSSPLHDLPERHRSMRNLFQQTWQHFSDREQGMLLSLTVFRGSFSFEAARSVADLSPFELQAFVNKSWLQTTDDRRFHFHELTRQFLQDEIETSDFELEPSQAAHADYYAGLFERIDGELFPNPYVLGALDSMRLEKTDAHSAWQWAVDHGSTGHIGQMLESFTALFLQESRYDETVVLMEQALAICDDQTSESLLAQLHANLGKAH